VKKSAFPETICGSALERFNPEFVITPDRIHKPGPEQRDVQVSNLAGCHLSQGADFPARINKAFQFTIPLPGRFRRKRLFNSVHLGRLAKGRDGITDTPRRTDDSRLVFVGRITF
jgi:hypothetical protein